MRTVEKCDRCGHRKSCGWHTRRSRYDSCQDFPLRWYDGTSFSDWERHPYKPPEKEANP